MQLAEQTVRYGNKWVITDGAIAAMNARSAMRSAFYSVRVNLQSITDEQYVRDMTEAIQRIEREAALLEQRVEREYERR